VHFGTDFTWDISLLFSTGAYVYKLATNFSDLEPKINLSKVYGKNIPSSLK